MSVKEVLIVRSKEGSLVSKSRVPGDLKEAVKKQVLEALSLWDVERADFTVIRDPQYPVSVKLPITKEQYEMYSKFDMSRTSDGSVVFQIPVYIISFDNEYKDDNYLDKEVFVVAPALDQKVEDAVVELAIESTKPEPEEEEEDEDIE
ncbi:MAG: DUF2286 domain-containing protein [Candidatus Methanomethylicaceae archaeon]|nr:DUF2286 domain-containing protein [Candidatus Verstraetearchaeota archaeon]